ncbi:unnamed protein product [Ectocarpus sp. 12 AP-2014]
MQAPAVRHPSPRPSQQQQQPHHLMPGPIKNPHSGPLLRPHPAPGGPSRPALLAPDLQRPVKGRPAAPRGAAGVGPATAVNASSWLSKGAAGVPPAMQGSGHKQKGVLRRHRPPTLCGGGTPVASGPHVFTAGSVGRGARPMLSSNTGGHTQRAHSPIQTRPTERSRSPNQGALAPERPSCGTAPQGSGFSNPAGCQQQLRKHTKPPRPPGPPPPHIKEDQRRRREMLAAQAAEEQMASPHHRVAERKPGRAISPASPRNTHLVQAGASILNTASGYGLHMDRNAPLGMGGGGAGATAAATVPTSSASGPLSLAPSSCKASDTDAPSTPSCKEWGEFWDEEVGASYYYNSVTGEALWVRPDGF